MAAAIEIGVRDLRANLSTYLRKAAAGARIVVVSRGRPIVTLDAVASAPAPKRAPGALAGQIWMAADFDTLPEDMLHAIEGDLPR